jgi:hypothetical protein
MANATISISRNWSLDDLELITAEDMREIGLLQREAIYRRTIAGIDANGRAFAPYSLPYEAEKRDALGSATPVNLQVSGNMLNHMQVVEVGDGEKPFVKLGWLQ